MPEESETTAETVLVSETEEAETEAETAETTAAESEMLPPETEVTTEESKPVIQETTAAESIAIPQVPIITETEEDEPKEQEETVKRIDKGDQNLVEYKPQIGGQPNPFDNDTPTEIDDQPVEEYIGDGEDRPGEGKHF